MRSYIPHSDFNRSRLRGRQNETTTMLELTAELAAENFHRTRNLNNFILIIYYFHRH